MHRREDHDKRKEGDENLLARYRDYLRVLAEAQFDARVRRRFDASDVVQETLLKAHERLDQYRGQSEGELMAWLRVMLVNELRDLTRGQLRDKNNAQMDVELGAAVDRSAVWLEGVLSKTEESPSVQLARGERATRLAAAILELPDDQRQAVILRHITGFTLVEAAARLERTEASVAGLLRRGLRNLREKLRPLE